MRILQKGSLTEIGKICPESFETQLTERDSRANVGIGPEAPSVSVGDWLKDDAEPGAGIIWRVQAVAEDKQTATRVLTLEQMIQSLSDKIIPKEVKPKDMGGSGNTCTARQAVEYLLGLQSDWVLGQFGYEEVSNPYSFSGDTVKAALETVSASLEGAVWSYDYTVYPFRLNILPEPTAAACEMRAGRNIQTLRVSVDKSRMYTRFYPVGKNNMRLPSPGYVSANEATWGVIERTETDQSKKTQDALLAWGQARVAKHSTPQVTITISGLDFSAATGEPLDKLAIGTLCRVPLPDEGVTILEKITKLNWRDKVKDPESVQVTLANNPEDVQSILSQEKTSGGRGMRANAETDEENALIIGDVASGLYTRIAQTASELRREAHDEVESMRTFVIQTASAVLSIAENDIESLRTVVEQTASSWSASIEQVVGSDGRVTAASIAVAINNSTGETEAKIDAQKVYIGNQKSTTVISGKAEVTDLQATDAKIESVTIVEGSARYIQSGKVYATDSLSVGNGISGGSGTFYFRGDSYKKTNVVIKNENGGTVAEGSCLGLGGTNTPINLSHYHKITVAEGTGADAGKLIVTLGAAQSTEGSANFNIADTQIYKSGVAAAKSQVGLADPTWSAWTQAGYPTSRTVTVKTTGRTNASGVTDNLQKDVALYLTANNLTVSMRTVSASGTVYAQATCSDANLVDSNIKSGVTIFGVTGTYGGGGVTPASHIRLSGPPSYSPSYSAGGNELTSWPSVIRQAVSNGGYVYFDAWLTDNTSDKRRYFMHFT